MSKRFYLAPLLLALLAMSILFVLPTEAQISASWQAAYYDNPYFLDPPTFERVDGRIAFDWGRGSPRDDIPNNNFSARWGTDVRLAAGTYRFYLMADEEAKVALDFRSPIINTFGNSQIGRVVSADAELSGGSHHIQIDFREFSGNASIYFSFESLADGVQGPDFIAQPTPTAIPPQPGDAAWAASYFTNTFMFGSASVIRLENDPSHNWGAGSPDVSIPIDNWSGRWTRNISLTDGTYRVSAQADDGVRVFIDNIPVIDEWHVASGQTYVADISLSAGLHSFVVEFYEGGGLASLDFDVTLVGGPGPVFPDTPTATVVVGRLYVRSQPSTTTGDVVTIIDYGDTFPALALDSSQNWVQISANGTTGWVDRNFVTLNNASGLPIVPTVPLPPAPEPQPQPTQYTVTANPFPVNIRTGPGTSFDDIGNLPAGATAQVVGRNSNSTWWQINYQGVVGWSSALYARIQPGADISTIPVTG